MSNTPGKLGRGSVKKWAQARSRKEAKASESEREKGIKQPPLGHDRVAPQSVATKWAGPTPLIRAPVNGFRN